MLLIYHYSLLLWIKGVLHFCFAMVAVIACKMKSLQAVQDFNLLLSFANSLASFRWWMGLTEKAWRFVCWWWRGRCDFVFSDLTLSLFWLYVITGSRNNSVTLMPPAVMVSQLLKIYEADFVWILRLFIWPPVLLLCVYNILWHKNRASGKIKEKVKYGCHKGKIV